MALWGPKRTHYVDTYPYVTYNQFRNLAEQKMKYDFKYVLNVYLDNYCIIGMRCQTLSPPSIAETGKPKAMQLAISDLF